LILRDRHAIKIEAGPDREYRLHLHVLAPLFHCENAFGREGTKCLTHEEIFHDSETISVSLGPGSWPAGAVFQWPDGLIPFPLKRRVQPLEIGTSPSEISWVKINQGVDQVRSESILAVIESWGEYAHQVEVERLPRSFSRVECDGKRVVGMQYVL
jgi:hypothetical protein